MGDNLGYAEVIRVSDRAILVDSENFGELWVPKSVVHDDSEVYDGTDGAKGDLIVKHWWAEKNQLI